MIDCPARPFRRFLVLLATLAASVAQAAPVTIYVGTYTRGTSRGIYRLPFDAATGELGPAILAVETKNPSFLALHPNGRWLYAVSEVSDFGGKETGAVSAFAIDTKTGDLALLNQQPSEGADPCHLVVDRSGRHVLVANYTGGTVAVLPIDGDGRLRPASSVRVHEGSGPDRERQERAHAHGIYLDEKERFALAPDLGADRVFVYRFDAAKGTLEPHGSAALAPGSGPRHLTFDASGRFVYVINELLSTVTAFSYDAEKGALASLQTITTLPAGFSEKSWTAEIAVSPDGRFVYGSNRGADSLAVLRVEGSSGRLQTAGDVPVGGKTPRHFAFDPSGRFVLAAHQNSGTIAVIRLDPETGLGVLGGSKVEVDRPVCLLPVPRR
jgi:6-phosphogluconolactonase